MGVLSHPLCGGVVGVEVMAHPVLLEPLSRGAMHINSLYSISYGVQPYRTEVQEALLLAISSYARSKIILLHVRSQPRLRLLLRL